MLKRFIISVVFFVIIFFVYNLVEQKLLPNSSQDLSVQQIKEDGSRELMRVQEDYQNYFDIFFYIVLSIGLYIIWKNFIISKFCKKEPLKEYTKEE